MPIYFFGSLAASASVFVAILTGLLINEYFRIKSESNAISRRLKQIEGELARANHQYETQKGDYDKIRAEWEAEYREEANQRVDDFIDDYIGNEFAKPIENFTVHDLLTHLEKHLQIEDIDVLEEGAQRSHHREVLEERMDEIEDKILPLVTRKFAKRFEGSASKPSTISRGPLSSSRGTGLGDFAKDLDQKGKSTEGITFKEFLNKYRGEFEIESIRDKTRNSLRKYFDTIVYKEPSSQDSVDNFSLFGRTSPNLTTGIDTNLPSISTRNTTYMGDEVSALPFDELSTFEGGFEDSDLVPGDVAKESDPREDRMVIRRYQLLEDDLLKIKSKIEGLHLEKDRLEDRQEELHPHSLKYAIFTNIITIFLSVVVPMFIFLLISIGIPIQHPMIPLNIEYLIGFVSWFIGLMIVVIWLYNHIQDGSPILRRIGSITR